MEYIKTAVKNTNSSEIQKILSNLNAYDDLLLLSGSVGQEAALEVNYLTPEGDVIKLGELPEEILTQIEDTYSDDVRVDIVDFGVYKREDGFKLWVGLEVKKERKRRAVNMSLIIGAGAVTGILTLLVVAIKFITLYRKKNCEL